VQPTGVHTTAGEAAALPTGEDGRKAGLKCTDPDVDLARLDISLRTQTSNHHLLNTERRRENRT
jgi:hypothetical protein